MRKIFALSFLPALLILSCGEPVKKDSRTYSDVIDARSMSVNTPLETEPVAVKDSIFNGPHVERYDNGVIYMQGEVEGGLRAGEWTTFYKSGKIWSHGFYKDGFRQGHGISYWENGQKSSEGEYKDSKMIGKWKFWDEQGNMVEKDFGAGQ